MPAPDAYRPLLERLGLGLDVACDPDWSAAPDFLELISEHVLRTRPEAIVECSSGLSTLVLAKSCRLAGQGHVFSLENGPDYALKSRDELARHGLQAYATVLDAPLIEQVIDGTTYHWYSLDNLPDHPIDMLAIDGPPGFLQKHARYPALPRLFDRLADVSSIFMDDAARPDERAIVEMWLARYPNLRHEYIDNARGCAVLQKGAGYRTV